MHVIFSLISIWNILESAIENVHFCLSQVSRNAFSGEHWKRSWTLKLEMPFAHVF